jgi:MFS superfamily sulfate permease-like transporter
VLEATGIVEIDFTAAQVLTATITACHAAGLDVAIARLESARAQQAIDRFGIRKLIGSDHLFQSVEEAVRGRRGAAVAIEPSHQQGTRQS